MVKRASLRCCWYRRWSPERWTAAGVLDEFDCRSLILRPPLRRMHDVKYLHAIRQCAIHDYVRQAVDEKFACACETSGASTVRHRRQSLDCVVDGARYAIGDLKTAVGFDVFRNVLQVCDSMR